MARDHVQPLRVLRDADDFAQVADLTEDSERVLIAKGGLGGHGNATYATSTNRAPRKTQPGLPGEEKDLRLHLKLLADRGLKAVLPAPLHPAAVTPSLA